MLIELVYDEGDSDFIFSPYTSYESYWSSNNTLNIAQSPVYKSVWDGSTNTSFEVDALLKIKELDVDKEFTYTYTPEDPIKNPLIATSFFNTSHFYNPFTICEWEEDANNTIVLYG